MLLFFSFHFVCYYHCTDTEQHTMRKSCKNKPTKQEASKEEEERTEQNNNNKNNNWTMPTENREAEGKKYVNCDYWVCACANVRACMLCVALKYILHLFCTITVSRAEGSKKKKKKKRSNNKIYNRELVTIVHIIYTYACMCAYWLCTQEVFRISFWGYTQRI